MHNSSGDLIYVTNEVGMSGRFLELARNGQLVPVSEKIQDRVKIAKELVEVEGKLKACNDRSCWRPLRFGASLEKRTLRQVYERLQQVSKIGNVNYWPNCTKIDQLLDRKQFVEEWTVDPTPMTSLVPRLVRKSDPSIAERNEVIDGNLNLTNEEICKLLDRNFRRDGVGCGDHLPKPWVRDFQVDTFLAAYRHPECRNRVHKLISDRRGLPNYPKA